jgi:hypothetical protein
MPSGITFRNRNIVAFCGPSLAQAEDTCGKNLGNFGQGVFADETRRFHTKMLGAREVTATFNQCRWIESNSAFLFNASQKALQLGF